MTFDADKIATRKKNRVRKMMCPFKAGQAHNY